MPASVGILLDAGDVVMGWPGGARMGRFRKSSGGQTNHCKEEKGALQKLSVHRALSPRTKAIKMMLAGRSGYLSITVKPGRVTNLVRDPLLLLNLP
jgi:hypothetical protein